MSEVIPWKNSLHGGHSKAFCDHAYDNIEDMIEAAIAVGYNVWGVTEHAPRLGSEFLYITEQALGWTVETLEEKFDAYAAHMLEMQKNYKDRITLLRGFECEVVPHDRYIEIMQGYRERYNFQYMVGSVHYVNGTMIDFSPDMFMEGAAKNGGVEGLAVAYYEHIAAMVTALKPEVVGHLDLIRLHAPDEESVATPKVRAAAEATLEVIAQEGAILDINVAGLRKNLGRPYVAPWLLERVKAMDIGVCFGDDSHGIDQVGFGLEETRQYLLENGFESVTTLLPNGTGGVKKEAIAL